MNSTFRSIYFENNNFNCKLDKEIIKRRQLEEQKECEQFLLGLKPLDEEKIIVPKQVPKKSEEQINLEDILLSIPQQSTQTSINVLDEIRNIKMKLEVVEKYLKHL